MADTYTIQFRRGMYADFDTSKIRPGEPVAILGNDPSVPSGKALYIAFAANDVRRLCSIEDISEMVNAGEFVGPQGPKGEKGDKGADGTVAFESLTPEQKESLRGISIKSASIDTDGNLIITFSDGGSEDVGNIMGPQGIQGPKGDKGDVGPQGPKGDKGDVGPKGDNMSDKQAAQIEQNKTDIASLKKETGSLKEDLSNKITKFYASSQGETHLADSDNGKIQDMMLYGKSEQKRYSGKNLLNYDAWKDTLIVRGTAIYENNGITLAATRNDCYTEMDLGTGFSDNAKIEVSEGETLTLSWEEIENKSGYIYIFGNGIASNGIYVNNRGSKKLSYTVPSGITFITFRFGVDTAGDTISYKNIQIEKGSTATTYEPYTGGIPSPNPDYPQEIKSVVNPTVKVCGKNLFNKESPEKSGYIIAQDGTLEESEGFNIYIYKYIDKPYTISYKKGKAFDAFRYGIESNGIITRKNEITSPFTVKLNKGERLYLSPHTNESVVYDIQIELGSTSTTYEPYHEQTVTLPYTLNAIPVSSGGNVTIDSQQYIADYVDVERGKLVRMCKEYVITGSERLAMYWLGNASYLRNVCCINNFENIVLYDGINPLAMSDMFIGKISENADDERAIYLMLRGSGDKTLAIKFLDSDGITTVDLAKQWLIEHKPKTVFVLSTPEEIDLTSEEVQAFKALATYYPITNISINSEQLDGYTVLNYPISMENGWNYVKQQIGDTRDYIYDMDIQSAEAYVNSEYAVALTELEV